MRNALSQPIRFVTSHRRTLHSVFTLLWVSGALWLIFHYFLSVPGEFGVSAHPLQNWWLRLHGLMAFAALIALGTVLPVHARRAWQLKKNRASGLGMKSIFAWLTLTGYALYYFASEANAAWLSGAHWVVGLALPLILIHHIRQGRTHYTRPIYQPHHSPASPAPFSSVASQPTLSNHSERNVVHESSAL